MNGMTRSGLTPLMIAAEYGERVLLAHSLDEELFSAVLASCIARIAVMD